MLIGTHDKKSEVAEAAWELALNVKAVSSAISLILFKRLCFNIIIFLVRLLKIAASWAAFLFLMPSLKR
ncbi:MAG: hypothetical protein ACXWFA_11310 [Methylobacter sp.]